MAAFLTLQHSSVRESDFFAILGPNAVEDFFTRENAWAYVVAEVVRLRAMPETTKFSRIRLPKSLTALPPGLVRLVPVVKQVERLATLPDSVR